MCGGSKAHTVGLFINARVRFILPYRMVKPSVRGMVARLSISEDEFNEFQKRSSVTSEIADRLAGPLVVFLFVASRCQLAAKTSPTGLTNRLPTDNSRLRIFNRQVPFGLS